MADRVQQFTEVSEALAGKVHVVDDEAQLVETVATIIRDSEAKCVALGDVPQVLRTGLERLCEAAGIALVAPPYDRAALPGAIDQAQVGIGSAAYGIAATGTLVEETTDDALRLVSALPRTYIGIVPASQLVDTLEDASPRVRAFFERSPQDGTVSFISGPSRTGDIEFKLTLGVHGPEDTHAIILQNGALE